MLLKTVLVSAVILLGAGTASARVTGHNTAQGQLRTAPLPRASGELHVNPQNTGEDFTVQIYNPDGSYNQAALAALDHLLRNYPNDEVRAVEPRLYENLSIISDHFGGKRILVGSGFRQRKSTSRHDHAAACDFRIEGVSYRRVYAFATSLDRGGMGLGIYPTTQFVHMDYRAIGEPSFRWVDTAGGKHNKVRRPAGGDKIVRRKKPNT
jgi:uncharacterized protein YcbK (DUF882 family)